MREDGIYASLMSFLNVGLGIIIVVIVSISWESFGALKADIHGLGDRCLFLAVHPRLELKYSNFEYVTFPIDIGVSHVLALSQ